MFVADHSDPSRLAHELHAQRVSHRFVDLGARGLGAAVAAELAGGFNRLAVVGGDPYLAEVIEAVIDAGLGGKVDVAIVSDRSDLGRTFALERGVLAAVGRMARGNLYPIDAGVVEGGFGRVAFVNSVATGVLAGGPGWFPAWPRPLRVAGRVVVRAGTSPVETMASGMLVLNGQFWGDWIGAPRSTLVDGVVDLQLFTGARRMLARLRPAFRTGMHVRGVGVRRLSIARAEVDQPRSWIVSVDGIRRGRGPFTVTVLPAVVRLAI